MSGKAEAAIKELVKQMLDPTVPFQLPRPTAPQTHPVIIENEIILNATDADHGLQGVLFVHQDLDDFIELYTPGASITVTSGTYHSLGSMVGDRVAMEPGTKYSVPGSLRNAAGTVICTAKKFPVTEAFGSCKAWNLDHNNWDDGYMWAFESLLNAASHNYVIDYTTYQGESNPVTGTCHIYQATDEAGFLAPGAHADIAVLVGDATYTDSNGCPGPLTSFSVEVDDVIAPAHVRISVSAVNVTYVGPVELRLPLFADQSFTALRQASTKYCIDAIGALFSFQGGMSGAGQASCALVPHGTTISTDSTVAISQIALLNKKRRAENPLSEGAHVSWIPDDIRQLWLREEADPAIPSQTVVIAFNGPPAGNLQLAQARIEVTSNIEFETNNPIYAAKSGSNAGMLMQAVCDVYGTVNPCSGNPSHMKKIADAAKKVASDPTVRMLAGLALKGGVTLAASFL